MNEQSNEHAVLSDNAEVESNTARDDEVLAMARELGIDDGDFDPKAAGVEDEAQMSEEEQLKQISEMAQTTEGSIIFASKGIDVYESLIQGFGNRNFKIGKEEKEDVANNVAPVIKKYGGSGVSLFGEYKDEVLAAFAVGMLVHGSIRQVKELNKIDKAKDITEPKEDVPAQPEQPERPEKAQAA